MHTLTRPLEGHRPSVGRIQIGMTAISPARPLYGTTLRCQCGWTLRTKTYTKIDRDDQNEPIIVRTSYPDSKVSNEAPSKGGRADAAAAYQLHVSQVLTDETSSDTVTP